jgi:hypothetical protein
MFMLVLKFLLMLIDLGVEKGFKVDQICGRHKMVHVGVGVGVDVGVVGLVHF